MTTYFLTPEGRTERIQHRVIREGKQDVPTVFAVFSWAPEMAPTLEERAILDADEDLASPAARTILERGIRHLPVTRETPHGPKGAPGAPWWFGETR